MKTSFIWTILWILILLRHTHSPYAATKLCPTENCNKAGACSNINNSIFCRCIGKFFTGTRCSEMVNHCASNPCQNGGTCTPVLGQYMCTNCKIGFGGSQCHTRIPSSFTKLLIFFNPTVVYGERMNFIMTVESIGATSFVFEAYTSDCLLATFTAIPKAGLPKGLRYSKNLISVASSLDIAHSSLLPYKRGYYYKFNNSFWDVGDIEITTRVMDFDHRTLFVQRMHVHVIQPDSVPCVPNVTFIHGNNPQDPISVDVARFNVFNAIVNVHCSYNSTIELEWYIYNSLGNVMLHDFGKTNGTKLKVPPYKLYLSNHEISQIYMLRMDVNERFDSYTIHKKVRCYIFLLPKPVSALLFGGNAREIGAGQTFELDGTQSRDFGLSPKVPQDLTYHWSCATNNDRNNKFCRPNIGKSSKLSIPGGALKMHKDYTFIFTVKSSNNFRENNSALQMIKIVRKWQHNISISCLRNCLCSRYVATQKIHLSAFCPSCEVPPSVFNWIVNDIIICRGSRCYFEPPAGSNFTVRVSVVSAGYTGITAWTLIRNEPPAGGSCGISPTSGIEYETEFRIDCANYSDENYPLSYQFSTDQFLLERTNERRLWTRLPSTSQVKVVICDFLNSCTQVLLFVSVSALKLGQNASAWLLSDDNNLTKLLSNGHMQRAMILANTLSHNVKMIGMDYLVLAQLSCFEIDTLLQLTQFCQITRIIIGTLQHIDNKKARLFTILLRKINKGFRNLIVDGELWELERDHYVMLSNEIIEMIAEFSCKIEQISAAENLDLSLRYFTDLLPAFDETVLVRIEHWMNAVTECFQSMYFVGVSGTTVHETSDDHYKITHTDAKMDVFVIEDTRSIHITSESGKAHVTLVTPLLAELQKQLNSRKVLVQLIAYERNPFWWYPYQHKLDTDVISFSAFSNAAPLHGALQLEHPIEFRLHRSTSRGHGADINSTSDECIKHYVKHTHDLRIFRFYVPKNCALIVTFFDATTKLHTKLQLCKKPISAELLKSRHIVPPADTLTITNELHGYAWAYLGILPAEEIRTAESYMFNNTIVKCVSWDFASIRNPQWTSADCVPKLNVSEDGLIKCRCFHLSVFAGQTYVTKAEALRLEGSVLGALPLNVYMITAYVMLLAFLAGLTWWAVYSAQHHKGNLVVEHQLADYGRNFDVLMHITTGGLWYATTTANIILTFVLHKSVRKFTIIQNPEHPHLVRNSTCSLRLPVSGDDLKQPILFSLRRDNAGRYPSWYCRSIVVEDYANELSYTFDVEQWIGTQPLVLDGAYFQEDEPTKWMRFKQRMETLCIQWFQNQPVLGEWKYGEISLNRFERTFIWLVKFTLNLCIVVCFMGRTTLENYEQERDSYKYYFFNGLTILFLCVCCYLCGLIVETLLKIFLFHDELTIGRTSRSKQN